MYAYGEYNYGKDGVDNTGDEVLRGWVDRVVDWNSPPSPAQAGRKGVDLTFGVAQFRKDSNRDNVSALDKPFYQPLYPLLQQYDYVLLMEKGVCNFPKLLDWDSSTPPDDARIVKFFRDGVTYDYNVAWWIKENYTDGLGNSFDTAYQRLFVIDNPRVNGIKTRPFTLEIQADCELIRTRSVDKIIRIPVYGIYQDAQIDEIGFNVNTNLLTISGKV